ncbi:hypothetical protein ACFSBZ_06070 [Amnibacterium flavum]|uniref:Uncharacterized protein n=1 Tax=Amnibacterium flavum TaxID=2173173 RepID=A0A2V1HSN8_9MICO|nr:hypothetical protein [Amnibacterium flavum]PVZ93970.1 hypothetical protein DDQ50_09415 [Amnibacterium flavum]
MTQTETSIRKTWVAFGPNGATASIHETDAGFSVNSLGRETYHGVYESLEVAKRAISTRSDGDVTFEAH